MKFFTFLFLMTALVAALFLVAGCVGDEAAQPTGVEIDIDAPKAKPKKPSTPKAPAFKAPTKVGKR
ncbi:hypothetical protein ACWDX6_24100 [Streptomyces sp. NPDC003027]